MITLQQIRYTIGKKTILDDLSFRAIAGQLTILLGANGAGKSTLLRLLAGETRPHSGSIQFNGRPLADYNPLHLAHHRAMLTQHVTVTLPFTGEEVVLMGRYPHFGRQPSPKDK